MSFTIVVVCAANVCRSPLAAVMLQHSLPSLRWRYGFRVLDCGEHAVPGVPACPSMLRWAQRQHLPTDELARHRATPLDGALLDVADLVLTVDRHTRSAVHRAYPSAAERTYTLHEAAALAEGAIDRSVGIDHFVQELNATRGLLGLPGSTTVRPAAMPWRRLELHEHDLPDAHRQPGVTHALVRRQLGRSVERLVDALIRVPHPL